MSDYKAQPGYGAMFFNDKSKDSQPDRKGEITAHRDIKAGEVLGIAGWLKKDRNQKSFLSLKLGDKREASTAGVGGEQSPSGADDEGPNF